MLDQVLLNKVIDVFKDDSGSLLGDYHFDADDLDELKSYFISRARVCYSAYNYSDNDIAVFIIIVINKLRDWNKEWSNSGLWSQINDIFDDFFVSNLINSSQHNRLYDGIASVFRKYGRVLFKAKDGDRAFVQTFLYQAMAPRISFEHFVNLAWRKYFDDLECDYSSSDKDFCEYVVNCLAKKITSPDEASDVQFGSSYYHLKSAFKYGIVQNKEKTINLLDKVLLTIDKVDKNNEDFSNDTLGSIVTDVVTKNKMVIPRVYSTNVIYRNRSTAHNFNQIRPILSMDYSQHEKPTISICFPRMILLGNEKIINQVQLTIYRHTNGVRQYLKSFAPRPIKNNGESSYTMSAFSEDLTEIYNSEYESFDYEFVLLGDNHEEYSSKKEFFRNYFVFNNEKEVKGNTKPGVYTLIVPKNFDINSNIKLFSKNSVNVRNLWKNIWTISTEDNDSIEYLGSSTIFSIQGMPANVRFENENIQPIEFIKVVRDNETYEVYRDFSNLHISNNDQTKPEAIRILHELKSITGDLIFREEKRLCDLQIVNHRYFYDSKENRLNVVGIHSLEVIKIIAGQGNKYLLNKRYIIDPYIKEGSMMIPYLAGNYNDKILFFNDTYEYECSCNAEETEIFIDNLNLTLLIKNPFFSWCFGSNLNEIHFSSLNLKKPILCNLIKSTNETIVIKTNLNIDCLMFQGNDISGKCKVFEGGKNTHLLGQFINSGKKEGVFYVEINGKRLYLFSITDKPYPSKMLGECVSLDNGSLKINLSEYFVHDDGFYNVKLTFINENGKEIEITDLPLDCEVVRNDSQITDGYYEAFLSYSKIYAGEESPYINFKSEEIELGDVKKSCFSTINKLYLNNFKTFESNSKKISCKDFYIENIEFKEYSLDGDCIFTGILKVKNSKSQKVQFIHKEGRVIKGLSFLYGKDDSIIKTVNFDVEKESFTQAQKDDNIVEFKTIYYKL